MFPYGEWNHVLHHLYPRVPWHKMRQAHDTMLRFPPYRENVVICDGYLMKGPHSPELPTVIDILAHPSRTYLPHRDSTESLEESCCDNRADANDRKLTAGLIVGES
jgi:hypothetical protein